jgi:DNA-binding IclR family transcriptional regulator
VKPLRGPGVTRDLILAYLRLHARQQWPASVRDVMAAAGLSSTSTAHAHLERLVRAGLVVKGRMGYRAVNQ